MQEFEFEIKYKPGSRMAHVDALSQTTHGSGVATEPVDLIFENRYGVCLTITQLKRVNFIQRGDPKVNRLAELLFKTDRTTQENR